MTTPKVVLRFERSTLARLNAITAHEQRTGGDLRHCDSARQHLNGVLVGSGDPGADIRARIAEMAVANLSEEVAALKSKSQHKAARERLRAGPKDPWDSKATRPLTRGLLSASPEWFGSPERVDLFAARGLEWLEGTFGESLVAASIHLDERTPHIHFELLPTVVKTSGRRGRQLVVSHRHHAAFKDLPGGVSSYERLQGQAGAAFADIGLARGDRHAEAERVAEAFDAPAPVAPKHTPPAEHRAQVADLTRTDKERTERAERERDEQRLRAELSEAEARSLADRLAAADAEIKTLRARVASLLDQGRAVISRARTWIGAMRGDPVAVRDAGEAPTLTETRIDATLGVGPADIQRRRMVAI